MSSLDLERYRVRPGTVLRLDEHDPRDHGGIDRKEAEQRLDVARGELREMQEKLWAHDRWSLLAIFQAPDAAGKDSLIEKVFSGVNPQGCHVHSFKGPSSEELDHDYLWRANLRLPERGRIGIFNRSHYEEVLIVRVHPEILRGQKLPPAVVGPGIWRERYEDIAAWERYLGRNGIVVRKFFLNLSREEQRERFLKRLTQPEKRWKFSLGDVKERALWDRYREAYEEAISATSTAAAPWYVVPADRKWFTRLVVMEALVATLRELDLHFPQPPEDQEDELAAARRALEAEKG